MNSHTHIHIKRYKAVEVGYELSIEPDDRSWILFLDKDGPSLWRRTELETEDGQVIHEYVNVEQMAAPMGIDEAGNVEPVVIGQETDNSPG